MPSRLGLSRTRGQRNAARKRAAELTPNQVSVGPFQHGYSPDLNDEWVGVQAAVLTEGLVLRGGSLSHNTGFEKLDSAGLPLGWVTAGPASAGDEQPVVLLDRVNRFTIPEGQNLAMCAATTAVPVGNLYRLRQALGVWDDMVYDTTPGPTAGWDMTLTDMEASTKSLPDAAYFPHVDRWIFTNRWDPVYQYPCANSANEYSDFSTGLYYDEFRARSVCTAQERICFLNTKEGGTGVNTGTHFPQYFRWSQIASLSLSGRGAGLVALAHHGGEGVACRKLGNSVACYMEDGVTLLRPTYITTTPWAMDVVDTRRGLVGTQAVVEVGEGVHFGIFNDGWYFLDENKQWTGVGMEQLPNGRTTRKWLDTFYNELNKANAWKVAVAYEPFDQSIRIAWPDNGSGDGFPNRVWTLDVKSGTVWPDNYASPNTPIVWGNIDNLTTTAETWDTVPGSWDDIDGTWDSIAGQATQPVLAHGTREGLVFLHRPGLITQDGINPSYLYQSFLDSFGMPTRYKTTDQIAVVHDALAAGTAMNVEALSENGVESATFPTSTTLTGVGNGIPLSSWAGFRLSGTQLGFRLSGTAPVRIHSVEMQLLTSLAKKGAA